MVMGNILEYNPQSWGCWTPKPPKHPGGQDGPFVLCINMHYEVHEYPVGVEWNKYIPFVRVLDQEDFRRLHPDTPLPDAAFFPNVEIHANLKNDRMQITDYADSAGGATRKYYTILVYKELGSTV